MLSLLSFPTNLFLLFGLLFILATIMNFKRGLLIFLFLTPLIPMSISLYLGESVPLITFQRVGLVVLILVWIAKYLVSEKHKIEKVPLLGLLSLFLLLVSITSVFSVNFGTSMREFFSERVVGIPFIYFLVFQGIRSRVDIKRFLCVLLISGFIVSVLGIYEFYSGENPFSKIHLMPEQKLQALGFGYYRTRAGFMRVQSTFSHPLGLAAYLVFLIPLAIALPFNSGLKTKRFLTVLLLATFTISLFFTFSRAVWLILIVILLILARKNKLLLLGTLLVVLLFVLFWGQIGWLSYNRIIYRSWLWKGGLRTMIQYPLLGTGLNTFKQQVVVLTDAGELTGTDPMVYFLNRLIENGILTFAILMALFLSLILKIKKASQTFLELKNPAYGRLSLSMLAAFVGSLLLSSFSLGILNSSAGIIIFWATVAVSMRLWLISKEERINKRQHNETNVI